jgi:hypothetical protein
MADITGTVKRAYGFTSPKGSQEVHTVSSDEVEIVGCYVDVEYLTGTYATANTALFSPATAIQDSLRDGRTVTIKQACFADSGKVTISSTDSLIAALGCTVSAGVVSNDLALEDLTTEYTNGTNVATMTWQRPITYYVTFTRPLVGE